MELCAFSTWQETIGDKTFVLRYLICDRINAVELMANCSVPNTVLIWKLTVSLVVIEYSYIWELRFKYCRKNKIVL